MKRDDVIVKKAMIVFTGYSPNLDDNTEILEFMGMYKSKFIASRVYKYEMRNVSNETIEAFEERFRIATSEDKKLRKEMRRYREIGSRPSLQVGISLGEFGGKGAHLVDSWTLSDQIARLARAGRSIKLSFCNDAEGKEVGFEFSVSFVKLLAKYQFSFRFVIG